MSWCDKLASTPSVGFKLDAHFASSAAILQALSPVLDKLVTGDAVRFTIDRQDAFSTQFTTEDGYQYGIEAFRIFVSFQHRLRARAVSGGLPVLEMLSRALPFTELLSEASDRLVQATLLLPDARARKVTRVGIVAATKVAEVDVPPGITRFIKYIGRPWKGAADHFAFQITAEVGTTSGATDRCIHTVSKQEEDPERLVSIQFDWQRTFVSGHAITSDSLEEIVAGASKASLGYFEELAEGNWFDEDLIPKTT